MSKRTKTRASRRWTTRRTWTSTSRRTSWAPPSLPRFHHPRQPLPSFQLPSAARKTAKWKGSWRTSPWTVLSRERAGTATSTSFPLATEVHPRPAPGLVRRKCTPQIASLLGVRAERGSTDNRRGPLTWPISPLEAKTVALQAGLAMCPRQGSGSRANAPVPRGTGDPSLRPAPIGVRAVPRAPGPSSNAVLSQGSESQRSLPATSGTSRTRWPTVWSPQGPEPQQRLLASPSPRRQPRSTRHPLDLLSRAKQCCCPRRRPSLPHKVSKRRGSGWPCSSACMTLGSAFDGRTWAQTPPPRTTQSRMLWTPSSWTLGSTTTNNAQAPSPRSCRATATSRST
mmetsp:Transcript_24155/g.70879  ORF Transcript_24155/g.70879 Transcript_24155/m.70879 type:complete len:340 (-) Transcript_24155:2272-3291(-)